MKTYSIPQTARAIGKTNSYIYQIIKRKPYSKYVIANAKPKQISEGGYNTIIQNFGKDVEAQKKSSDRKDAIIEQQAKEIEFLRQQLQTTNESLKAAQMLNLRLTGDAKKELAEPKEPQQSSRPKKKKWWQKLIS